MGVCNVYLINSRPLCTHDMLYTWSSQKRKLKEYGLERESLVDGRQPWGTVWMLDTENFDFTEIGRRYSLAFLESIGIYFPP